MLLSDEPAAEPPAEEEPEAPPTPSWRPFLVSLATPEEYSLEPLLAKASELDRFEVVEVEAFEHPSDFEKVEDVAAVEEVAVGFARSIRYSTSFWRSIFYTAFNLHVII